VLKSRLAAIALTTVTALAATSAKAATVTFEDIANSGSYSNYDNAGFSTQGFDFHLSFGNIIDSRFWVANYYATKNGTDWLMHNDKDGDLTVSAGGSLFELSSVDAGQIWNRKNSKDIEVTGYLQNGTTVSQTIMSKSNFKTVVFDEWNHLWKVTFSGNGYGAYDNFVLKKTNTRTVRYIKP